MSDLLIQPDQFFEIALTPAKVPDNYKIVREDSQPPYKIIVRQGSQYWLHTDPEQYPKQSRVGGGSVTLFVLGVGYMKGMLVRSDITAPFAQIVKLDSGLYVIKIPGKIQEFRWSEHGT